MSHGKQSTKKCPLLRGLCAPILIACFAFGLRILALYVAWRRGFEPGPYAFEAGRIAASIASGHGFSSPLASLETGATAWLCPIFPYLLAGVFRVWGVFTFKSLAVIQILNCMFASLTVFPVYAIARRSFGTGIAILAAWLWVFLPSAVHTPVEDIWDTALTALLFALIFWATLAIREQKSVLMWASYGILWAIAALVNASVLSTLPFFLAWLVWRRWKNAAGSFQPMAVAIFAFILILMPWTIRNYRAFGAWIPLRSNFGLEFWLGNNQDANDVNSFSLHPFQNPSEASRFKSLGEIEYMSTKGRDAMAFIKSHPGTTIYFVLRRVAMYWFAVTDRPRADWNSVPLYVKALLFPNLLMILFSWFGAIMAIRTRNPQAMLFATVLLVFPLPYYATHALVRYRFPLDPIVTILSIYGVTRALAWTRGRWHDCSSRNKAVMSRG